MKKKMLSVLLTGAMMLTLAGCGSTAASSAAPEPETTVTIFIAASLEKAFTDEGKLLDMYKALQPNVTVEVNAGSSGTLLQQIQEGAPCDLFFSAGKKQVTSAEEGGFVIDGSVVDLLENKVVLVKRAGDDSSAVTGFGDMTNASSMALCADSVPAGQYARLIFENMGITDDILNNPDMVIRKVNEMHRDGFVVELDDFGTGYSSLSMFGHMDIDVVKLDMSFIRQEQNEQNDKMIRYIIDMCKNMGLSVLSEGVETEEQRQRLIRLGCDYVQGYYYSKPLPEADFIDYLQKRS